MLEMVAIEIRDGDTKELIASEQKMLSPTDYALMKLMFTRISDIIGESIIFEVYKI
jgi:hypothetical protein